MTGQQNVRWEDILVVFVVPSFIQVRNGGFNGAHGQNEVVRVGPFCQTDSGLSGQSEQGKKTKTKLPLFFFKTVKETRMAQSGSETTQITKEQLLSIASLY